MSKKTGLRRLKSQLLKFHKLPMPGCTKQHGQRSYHEDLERIGRDLNVPVFCAHRREDV